VSRAKSSFEPVALLGVGIATVAFALAVWPKKGAEEHHEPERVVAGEARYTFDFTRGTVAVSDVRGDNEVTIEASLVVDGTLRPLAGPSTGTDTEKTVEVSASGLRIKVALVLDQGLLRARVLDPETFAPHRVELRFDLPANGSVWVPGAGELSRSDSLLANAAMLDRGDHPFVVVAPFGAKITLEPPHGDPKNQIAEDASLALEPDAAPLAVPEGDRDGGSDEPQATGVGTGRLIVTTERVAPPPPLASDAGSDAAIDAGRARDGGTRDASADGGADGGADDDDERDDDETATLAATPVVDGGPKLDAPLVSSRKRARPELAVFLGKSPEAAFSEVWTLLGLRKDRVFGRVTGATSGVRLYGVDDTGHPQVRATLGPSGEFAVEAPPTVDHWYALQGTATSMPIRYPPGTGWPLVLDLSPGGEIAVTVIDADTKKPIPSRLWVHGIEGTLDPSFGPDFRASGAGPLIDVLNGDVVTPLPKGRYRVEATHGLEWTVDAKVIDVKSGQREPVKLELRHAVATPGMVGCDLHVHARPSFDTLVSVEDRVTTLVTAGVEFAVPTEHNVVGDYGPATAALGLGRSFSSVTGVEVTTYGPRYGHFGVFPYPLDQKVPPYRQVRAGQMFEAARKGDPTRIVQVNHPRLGKGIGYFNIAGFSPKNGVVPVRMRTDFDTIEVYNGYEIQNAAQVESVLADWLSLLAHGHKYAATGSSDSHTVQYNWAGYPRTLVRQDDPLAGEPGHPADPTQVVAAIKAGRSIVTSGPVIDLVVDGGRPGEEVSLRSDATSAHVIVTAAPWIDVTSLEIYVDGKTFVTKSIAQRPSAVGREGGTLAELQARAVRFEGDVPLTFGPGKHFVVAVARGQRKAEDVLPFMPFAPMAITNPVWIVR
jgi:ribosomal protein S19